MSRRALTDATLGAWLVKARPADLPGGGTGAALAGIGTRCVRPSYRTGLVRAGQPLLLWVSGTDPALPAGIRAHGVATGPVQDVGAAEPFVPVLLRATDPPIDRREVLAHPLLAGLEVLRMPAGSNPSFLDVEQYAALCRSFPQVTAPVEPARGGCASTHSGHVRGAHAQRLG